MNEALQWLEEFLASPSVGLIQPTDASLNQTIEWMRRYNLGRKRILDAHLAAVLYTHGITRLLTSNPGDFTVFTVLQIVTP
jgi:hypothetical protein